jgi:hypothetical protein
MSCLSNRPLLHLWRPPLQESSDDSSIVHSKVGSSCCSRRAGTLQPFDTRTAVFPRQACVARLGRPRTRDLFLYCVRPWPEWRCAENEHYLENVSFGN